MSALTLFLFVVGFIVLVRGADALVNGASRLARAIGVSDLVVGLTVVAFGTSLPELIVNLFASGESGDLAIGNILGSNIANILLILGISAMIHPLTVRRATVYREILFNIGAAVMLGVLVSERFLSEGGFDGLDHIDGVVLMSYFALFLHYTFGNRLFNKDFEEEESDTEDLTLSNTFVPIILGAVGLYLGGQWIVNGAIEFATFFGVSDALIGLTVVAVGTSLPELTASIVAVRKKNVDIAVGNIVGSNLFNIFWVLGLTAFINPLPFNDDLIIDVGINILVGLILFGTMVFGRYRHQISRSEGRLFVALYVVFLISTILRG